MPRIAEDSRVSSVMENYQQINGAEKAQLLDALVFISMNIVSIRGTAMAVAPTLPAYSLVLELNASAMMSAIINLADKLQINRLDLTGAIGALCKDIGEARAESHPKQG